MIFLTGGTGFIGSRLLGELLRRNEKIYFLARRKVDLQNYNIIPITADVTEVEIFSKYLQQSDILIHLAACAKAFSKDRNEFYRTNYVATKILVEEALRVGVKKIIYISTCMVFGPSSKGLKEDDFQERDNFFTDYEKSKYLAEVYIRKKIKEGAPIIVLYPTRVFGPGKLTQGNSLTKLIYFFMKFHRFPVIESHRYRGNYVYIGDVVNIILRAAYEIRAPQTLLVGGYNLSFFDFFRLLNGFLGYNGKLFVIRKTLAMRIARFFENLGVEWGIPVPISRDWVQTFATDWLFLNDKVKSLLNYKFVSFQSAIQETVKWLKEPHR